MIQKSRREIAPLKTALLIDESIRGPHALFIAIRGIDEFDLMADYTHDAKLRLDRRRNAFEAFEELLHLLLLAGSRMLVGRIELVFGETSE